MENIINAITTMNCPHCNGEVFVHSQTTPAIINSIFTDEQLTEAKEDCLARIVTLAISDEKKEQVTKWINDPSTIFSPSEVENIILSLLNPEQ